MDFIRDRADDPVYENRRQLMAWVHLASGIALSLFIAIHLAEGCCYELSIAEAALAVVMLFTYWRIRSGASLIPVENTLMASAVALFSSLILFQSMENTGIYWVAGMPFVAYFVLQANRARYWVGFFVVELAVIASLKLGHVIDSPYSAAQIFCLVAVLLFYWVLAHIYKSQLEHRQMMLHDSYQRLAIQQSRMQVILDHSPVGIWMIDTQRHIQFLNRAWVAWTGISEQQAIQTDDYSTLMTDALAARSLLSDQACLNGQGACYFQEEVPCADGRMRTFDMIKVKLVDAAGSALGVVGFAIDVTGKLQAEIEHTALERQVQHSQRLESLGVMAGGIAHDFNNLLTAIQGSVELARLEDDLSTTMQESLQCIETASRAATDLCRQMLAYSGKGLFKPELFQLCDMVHEMWPLLGVSVGKNILLNLHCAPDACLVQGDKGQINQVLLNLVINASEAIGADQQGKINVAVRLETLAASDPYQFNGIELKPGHYVVLTVEDSGCGMDAEVIEHMFDPFFTTKFTGRGLGMSAVLGILSAHDAAIEVQSRPGDGTAISVWLPQQGCGLDDCGKTPPKPAGNSGRVLVVDDEQAVLSVACRMLERLGLSVVTAGDGKQAVDIFSNDPSFDWVLLDVTMPEMDGVECLNVLRGINPDLYVVMSSGYDQDNAMATSNGIIPNDFLTNPYTIGALKGVVEKAPHAT